jgi:hypothetical protein
VPKKDNIRKLKKKAWDLLSKIVRLKYSDPAGYVQCYTCGKRKPLKEMQAGHGFSGRGNAILYEEDIIRPQCFACNCLNSGKLDIFTYKLRTELGNKRFEELWKQKHTQVKFTKEELKERIKNYKERLNEVRQIPL